MTRIFLTALTFAFIITSQAFAHAPEGMVSSTNPHAHHMPAPKPDTRAALNNARTGNAANIGVGDFQLMNQDNQPVTHQNLMGKYSLVFFGFTRCGDECPTALSLITETYEQLSPAKQKQLQVIMVSVDTEYDTPAILKKYVTNFNPTYQGWTGTPAQVDAMTKQYVAYYAIKPDEKSPSTYQVAHSAFIYLMGPDGKYIGHFSHKDKPETLLSGVDAAIK